uniref:Uncharacterized protein n=2 Tax=Lepeophtheirus salmonis TaxID=72036 RepID=A0A0K2U174_LEPSM
MSIPWIELVSEGGLAIPSCEFLKFCHFKSFHCNHEDTIDKNPNVFERLHNHLIELYPNWHKEVSYPL